MWPQHAQIQNTCIFKAYFKLFAMFLDFGSFNGQFPRKSCELCIHFAIIPGETRPGENIGLKTTNMGQQSCVVINMVTLLSTSRLPLPTITIWHFIFSLYFLATVLCTLNMGSRVPPPPIILPQKMKTLPTYYPMFSYQGSKFKGSLWVRDSKIIGRTTRNWGWNVNYSTGVEIKGFLGAH